MIVNNDHCLLFKIPVCDSVGFNCSEKLVVEKDNCLNPCEGVYADIRREDGEIVDETIPGMEDVLAAYEKYKNQFQNDSIYPVSGKKMITKKT